MFNHYSSPSARWCVSPDGSIQALLCNNAANADLDVELDGHRYTEMCFSYGDKSNTEWVYEHGFIPQNNTHDSWPYFVDITGSPELVSIKHMWMEELGLSPRIMLRRPDFEDIAASSTNNTAYISREIMVALCLEALDDCSDQCKTAVGAVTPSFPYIQVRDHDLIDDDDKLLAVRGLPGLALDVCISKLKTSDSAMAANAELLRRSDPASIVLHYLDSEHELLRQIIHTAKRDALIEIEKKWQKDWKENHMFEMDMPEDTSVAPEDLHKVYPKWMGTFPYPYMNGTLHLGHAFSMSKIEFATGWERLQGKNALFPFGFHVTGMPIKAAADKIVRELELFGPNFELPTEKVEEKDAADLSEGVSGLNVSGDNFRAKKTKMTAKFGNAKHQFQIMQSQGLSNEEIAKFADAEHWLEYYPPIAMEDLDAMGCKIDWRRAFLTTDYNPYYDSFARWQFERLHEMGKIKFGKRYTIWSPKDGQPCMDHDRQVGEGVNPQEYTGIKLEVREWSEGAQHVVSAIPALAGKRVFLVAATLRPETMYGQTNCFVGVSLEYGFFAGASADEVYVISERSARNMAFQDLSPANGKVEQLGSIGGKQLVGSRVDAPLSCYTNGVFVLPMDNVLATKGTGVVTSVPSDSPDDYAALRDLKKKPEYYGIRPEWVADYEPVSVLSTPTYGDMTAPALCEKLKINSQKDRKQLEDAKEIAYKEGFYNGTMTVGDFVGQPVAEVKTLVREQLIATGQGFAYAEPDKLVTSRSGDECVVALCDQWYFDYGESEWRALTERCLAAMDTYGEETRHQFELTLGWLHQWACVRTYGLGSRVPWDQTYLIESLSDSTIYMSYYTVAHLLHRSLDGSVPGPLGITPADMDSAAWDYVLLGKPLPAGHSKPAEMDVLRRSFLYWYPVDIRSSGKDLIQNHLTFFLYIHTALFPESEWPQSVRTNGHLLLNGEKMSKSTGNSMTLRNACLLYGADAMRLTLADAGDSIEDANFEETTANAAILRMYTLLEWVTDAYAALAQSEAAPDAPAQVNDVFLRPASAPLTAIDRVFDAEIDALTLATGAAYKATMYREALKSGHYEFINSRKWYIDTTASIGMHPTLVRKWVTRQVLMLSPITPHWSEHVWRTVMGNPTSVLRARWPADLPSEPNHALVAAGEYARSVVHSVRDAEAGLQKRTKKKGAAKAVEFNPAAPKTIDIYVASKFPEWQEDVIAVLKDNYDSASGKFDDKQIIAALNQKGIMKQNKKAMPFAQEIKKRVTLAGPSVFDRALAFKETEIIADLVPFIENGMGYTSVTIIEHSATAELTDAQTKASEIAVPGEPSFLIANAQQ
ncbi:cytosolic leucyl tRNA synthetase [Coemansia interrupta]|uniref:leucine--tRNA ligase n=1 Tax=Coemansia interrupta TaxID=1126814 RepID=A0A9W8LLV0_9FUNG|nr:cytosolic leucyl tRNA synthetase [Coemansia interrupta]